ncbi:MAG: hypothetical protein AAF620_20505 [Bacteroidota bacterium]
MKNTSDFRKESYRPVSHDTEIKIVGEVKPDRDDWKERRKIVLNKVYPNLKMLSAEAKNKEIGTSLAVFKPTQIHQLEIKEVDREWSQKKLDQMKQLNLFDSERNVKFTSDKNAFTLKAEVIEVKTKPCSLVQ